MSKCEHGLTSRECYVCMSPMRGEQGMSINDGGPAFPRNILDHGHGVYTSHQPGMTLRDYFAAKAMQGLCTGRSHADLKGHALFSAKVSYEIAEAMLKARGQHG